MALLHRALACDLARVATLQWSTAQAGTTFPWLGFSEYHHELSHAGDSGAGTLLDNTGVVWVNELAKGNTYSHNDVLVMAGALGGSVKTGRYLNCPGTVPHNDLFLSLIQGMGLTPTTFRGR
jgi:hypothetical protein